MTIDQYIYTMRRVTAIIVAISICNSSCRKLIEVDAPVTSVNAENVYESDATAAAVLTGIYTRMSETVIGYGGLTSMSVFPSLSADELGLYNNADVVSYVGYYSNSLSSSNIVPYEFWNPAYQTIFIVNSAIEGLDKSIALTPAVKQQLTGEAKFIRAFCYFYLVNLYGDVPLVVNINWENNATLPRTSKAEVYQQIINDCKDAQTLLSSNYLKADALSAYPISSAERVRPTSWAATAFLARVYLYTGDYWNAEQEASAIINNISVFSLPDLNEAFLKTSTEAIWQLQPVQSGVNTSTARLFIIPETGLSPRTNPVYMSQHLLNSFETGDNRKAQWVDSVVVLTDTLYHPYKYKIWENSSTVTEYEMILRLGEQYLVRAEARAQLNNITGAQSDLNMIRNRAGLPNTNANSKPSLLTAVLHERQVELFTEWGHRWLDLKRTGKVDEVMSVVTPQKGGTWNSNWQWYPIPVSELMSDPNLVQNDGY